LAFSGTSSTNSPAQRVERREAVHAWRGVDDASPPVVYVAPTTMLLPPTFVFILPALPSRAERPRWAASGFHEIKHDGYRTTPPCVRRPVGHPQ
jgi:hypothetical protein